MSRGPEMRDSEPSAYAHLATLQSIIDIMRNRRQDTYTTCPNTPRQAIDSLVWERG